MIKDLLSFDSVKKIFLITLIWRIVLFIVVIISTSAFVRDVYPFPYVDTILTPTGLPQWVWGFANFDGAHYIRIGLWGYASEYSQAFFPFYPVMMSIFSSWNYFFDQRSVLLLVGLLISFLSFAGALFFIKKIYTLEFPKVDTSYSLLLLLLFPTSFYFISVYTEGLFIFLSSISVYLILKKKFLYASFFIALTTATRVTGILLVGVYFIEVLRQLYFERKKEHVYDLFINLFGLLIASSGLVLYMFYLYYQYNDPLYFLHSQPAFGRQIDSFVLFPQVFYRYIKILLIVPFLSSQFFTSLNELLFSLFGIVLLIFSFRKIRLSLWLFSLGIYLMPTITGTFLSMPRFVLLLFLLFPVLAIYTHRYKRIIISLFLVLQIFFCSMFVLGFWIA